MLPLESSSEGIQKILERVSQSGQGSFLAVLKRFGPGNDNHLSFPTEGITLALDFKVSGKSHSLLDSLDELVLDYNGRLYLAKDARMPRKIFQAGYPNYREFLEVKSRIDPDNRFISLQALRLGLLNGDDS